MKHTAKQVASAMRGMPGDRAMKAVKQEDPAAQKNLVAKSLAKPNVNCVDDITSVLGIKKEEIKPITYDPKKQVPAIIQRKGGPERMNPFKSELSTKPYKPIFRKSGASSAN